VPASVARPCFGSWVVIPMPERNNDDAGTARMERLSVLVLVVAVVIVVALVRSVLETPSGDGVPGPAEWARYHKETSSDR